MGKNCLGITILVFWVGVIARGVQSPVRDIPSSSLSPEVFSHLPLLPAQQESLRSFYSSRNYSRAEQLLVDASARDSQSPELLTIVGTLFFLDGKYLNCAVAMKKAEKIAPLADEDRFLLAMSYIVLNHRDWARPELEKLARSNPNDARYPYWLGRIEFDLMQYTAAASHLRVALTIDPAFMKAYDNLGLTDEGLGQYDEAIRAYQHALSLNRAQEHPSAWPPLNLGTLLVKLGRLSAAEACLQESLRYDPRFSKAHYEMGLLGEKEQKSDAALQELRSAAQYDPTDPECHYAMGGIYRRLGDKHKAAAEFAIFRKLKQANPNVALH